MAASMTTQTRKQTQLFGEFLAALENLKDGMEALALRYKECVDAGVDLSLPVLDANGIPRGLVLILARIAEGRLVPHVGYRLLSAPKATVQVVASLPHDTQRKLAQSGVAVARGNTEVVVPLEEVMAPEARRLCDPVTGRLLPPKEQAARAAPRPKRTDQRIELTLTREQYNDLALEAKRSSQSIQGYILTQLVKIGVLSKRSKEA